MAEITNSKLLDIIIAHARELGGGGKNFTAEQFLLAICDYIDGTLVSDENEDAKQLDALIENTGLHTADVKTKLSEHIDDKGFMAGLYIQRKLIEAEGLARKEEKPEITPDILLHCILCDPSEIIAGIIGKPNGACEEKKSDDAVSEQTDSETQGEASDATPEERDSELKPEQPSEQPKQPEQPNKKHQKNKLSKLTNRVSMIREHLSELVYGQDKAISLVASGYFQAELLSMTDKKRVAPRATFLFAGPPGVGKTFLAEKTAEELALPFMRFDMSEYSGRDSVLEFCGSDKVYKDSRTGNVTGFVKDNPKCVLLFDEIEKAHISIIHLFLQLLDAGRLRDAHLAEEIPFTEAILFFTTNAGKQLYEQAESGDYSDLSRKVILKALQNDTVAGTNTPFFPAAICSRFAAGNVVMFNQISAHNLCGIAKREILRQAKNFSKELGIHIEIDDLVYTALLFSEGGAADARTIRSRAESFFDEEIFELLRLVEMSSVFPAVEKLNNIHISIELPEDNKEVNSLFIPSEKPLVLVAASEETVAEMSAKAVGYTVIGAQTLDMALEVLRNEDVEMVLIDFSYGRTDYTKRYLNAEDIDSVARDVFRGIRETHRDMPIYLLKTLENFFEREEMVSFMRLGVRGTVDLDCDYNSQISEICSNIHQQSSMIRLAKANKVISFETAQSVSVYGNSADIKLFDFRMGTAVEAEDSASILSNLSKPDVRFDQIIGSEDAKTELSFFVDFLKNPRKHLGSGIKPPKGIILYGPPGTGKTMLAKAMAGESNVTFITAEGNQFLKKYVGEGPDLVHDLFRKARKYAPAILFVDEIDAIAKERNGGDNSAANGADVLTAFLSEMDGFKNDPSKPVFVLAATNFDVKPGSSRSLDQALMRRFDRKIYIDLPNKDERLLFMKRKLAGNKAFDLSDEKLASLAVRSTGMSLAALESVFELALRSAIRDGNFKVTDSICDEAFETYNNGEEKKWDSATLERVARHESGHAFLCWHSGETPSYLTIVARGDHGGYMQHDDKENKAIYTKDELLARIRVSLGGRAAETVYYGDRDGISTGASGDLVSATQLARNIICTYGMDSSFGLAVVDAENEALSAEVRKAVNEILEREMANAVALITENRAAIDSLVEQIISKNHLTGSEIAEIFANNAKQSIDK